MVRTLESFAKENRLFLKVTKTTEEKREFSPGRKMMKQREVKSGVRWACELTPPIMARTLRVKRKHGSVMLMSSNGATLKEARGGLIAAIRGGVLEYSNAFDRECGDDPKIPVPKNLR